MLGLQRWLLARRLGGIDRPRGIDTSARVAAFATARVLPEFRDVFVIDHAFDLKTFLQQPEQRGPDGFRRIVHPSSAHAISAYSVYLYNHQKYNYNDLGEFSLSLLAAEQLGGTRDVGVKRTHDVILWPDGVVIHDLTEKDIPTIGEHIINKNRSVDDIPELLSKLSCSCVSSVFSTLSVVSKVSKSQPISAALQTLTSMKVAFDTNPGFQRQVNFMLAVETSARHRLAANVMILPDGDQFEAVWSAQQASSIAAKFSNEK